MTQFTSKLFMSYQIINNLSSSNHGKLIKSSITKSDEVIIASPYLFKEFKTLVEETDWCDTRSLHLITTLKDNSEEQFEKIASLKSLVDQASKNNFSLRISIDNYLHGKIYIFKSNQKYQSAVISSANCTYNGFYSAREWGIELFSAPEIANLHADLLKNLDRDNLQPTDIYAMYDAAEEYKKEHGQPKLKKIPLELSGLIKDAATIVAASDTKYFLKPIGHSAHHVSSSDMFDSPLQALHFAKQQPKDIKAGDIFIAFAVGSGRVISVYRMKSPLKFTTPSDRWPWYMDAENLAMPFAKNWWKNNLTKENLKKDFNALYPSKNIKPSWQSQTFGAFQHGRDRMEITADFARYIIGEVLKR